MRDLLQTNKFHRRPCSSIGDDDMTEIAIYSVNGGGFSSGFYQIIISLIRNG